MLFSKASIKTVRSSEYACYKALVLFFRTNNVDLPSKNIPSSAGTFSHPATTLIVLEKAKEGGLSA